MPFRYSILGLVSFALAGCATIVEGTDQSIMVNLSPENATCDVIREGTQLTTISKDNRFINVSKSKNDLVIECEAPDHYDETLTLESSASGWGVVGCFLIDLCITDYSTGALNKYPESITIALAPKHFESPESRDRWFEERRNAMAARWDELIEEKRTQCRRATAKAACESELEAMKEKKLEDLAKLESRRSEAEISSPAARPVKSGTTEARLSELEDLLDRGLISREEYDAKRSEILSEL